MSGKRELDAAIAAIVRYHSNISILHCVSEYPAQPQNVNLNTIPYLIEHYSEFRIGYSDHTIGISAAVAAVALGASIIEKHVTIDRRMKGTDQSGSLGPDGVNRMIRDIRLTEFSMGQRNIFISEAAKSARNKLERLVASIREIKKGEIIQEIDLHLLSPGLGLRWSERSMIIGKRAKDDIEQSELILLDMVE